MLLCIQADPTFSRALLASLALLAGAVTKSGSLAFEIVLFLAVALPGRLARLRDCCRAMLVIEFDSLGRHKLHLTWSLDTLYPIKTAVKSRPCCLIQPDSGNNYLGLS